MADLENSSDGGERPDSAPQLVACPKCFAPADEWVLDVYRRASAAPAPGAVDRRIWRGHSPWLSYQRAGQHPPVKLHPIQRHTLRGPSRNVRAPRSTTTRCAGKGRIEVRRG